MRKVFKKKLKKYNSKEWNEPKDYNDWKDLSEIGFAQATLDLVKDNRKNKKEFDELNSLTDVSEEFIQGFASISSYPSTNLAKAVEFIDCGASSELAQMVWLVNSKNGDLTSANDKHGKHIDEKPEWKHISECYCLPITKKRDMYIQFDFSEVNDKIICKYYGSSNIVNFDMIRKWMDKNIFVNGLTRKKNNHEANAYLKF